MNDRFAGLQAGVKSAYEPSGNEGVDGMTEQGSLSVRPSENIHSTSDEGIVNKK